MLIALLTAHAADGEDVAEVVVVTATRSERAAGDQPVAVQVIDRATLEATGAESLAELLQEQPGIQIDQTVTGASIRLQGMEPEHTLILIDGQRVLGRKDGVIDLARLSLQDVERVEIVKGPSSALFGSDAMGGVVNIVTRRGTSASAGTHVRAGLPGRLDADADATVPTPLGVHRLSASWHSAASWDRDPSTPATDSSAFEQRSLDYKGTFDTSEDSELTLAAGYQVRDLRGLDSTAVGAVLDRYQTVEDGRASIRGWVTPTASTRVAWSLGTGWYRDQFALDQRGSKDLDQHSDTHEANGEGSVQVDVSAGRHFVTVGLDGLYQRLRSDRLGTGDARRFRGAVFAQDVWARPVGDAELQVSPGLRLDVDSQFGRALTPRVAASLGRERAIVRAATGLGFRAPDFRELYLLFENPGAGYVVVGTDDLRPERSANVNGGVEVTPVDGWSVSVSGFANAIRDLVSITDLSLQPGALQRYGYANVGRASTAGGELGMRGAMGPLTLTSTAAYTRSRDLDADRPLPGRSPLIVTGAATLDLGRHASVRTQANASSSRVHYASSADGDRAVVTPGRLTTDVRASWRPPAKTGSLELFAGVDNLLDDPGSPGSPLPPRFVYAGFTTRTTPMAP
ncbi:MAG: TonB-dependent receptor [Alphaproteobacteria bacterium]|nr:TonB-dependent receptor [Alphaproteobacteria bacterium]MCB9692269.1 TonB-dependent receptor [Alphaproteobacteria bacterium]